MALDFFVPQYRNRKGQDDPVHVVRNHRAKGCRVGPPEDGIKHSPATATVQQRTAALEAMSVGVYETKGRCDPR